ETMKKKTELHRRLADILLSEDTIFMAAEAAELGKTFDPAKHNRPLNPREALSYSKKLQAHAQFFRSTPEAREFIETQSARIPRLIFRAQASLMDSKAMKYPASQLWREVGKVATAGEIIELLPDFFEADCKQLLNEQCKSPPPRR